MARYAFMLVVLVALLSACSHGGRHPAAKSQATAGATVTGKARNSAIPAPAAAPGSAAVTLTAVPGSSASGLYDVGQFFVPESGQVQASNRTAMVVLQVQAGDLFRALPDLPWGASSHVAVNTEYYLTFNTVVAGTRLYILIGGVGTSSGTHFEQIDDGTYRVETDSDAILDVYEQPDGGYKPARDHTSVVNRFGHLLIDPNPMPTSAVVEYNTGEGLDVSAAQRIGTLSTDLAYYTRTYCDDGPCYLFGGDNRAPVDGRIECGDPVELVTGAYRLTFDSAHTRPGQATPVPGPCTSVAHVAAGERVSMPYTPVYVRAYTLDGQPLSIVVAGDGTLYVGNIVPKFSCGPCRGK